MKIVCPACEAIYQVPDAVVVSRRKMRCARCNQDWVPADVMDAAATPPLVAPAVQAPAPPPAPASPAVAETGGAPAKPAAAPSFGRLDVTAETLAAEPAPPPGLSPVSGPGPGPVPAVEQAEARHDDEPYQLALRPETHISVFPPASGAEPGPSFGMSAPRIIQTPAKGPPVLAWSLSILVLLGVLGGAFAYRGAVMRAWPPSIRLYSALGFPQQ